MNTKKAIFLKIDEKSLALYEEDCATDFVKKHLNEALMIDKKLKQKAGYIALTDGFESCYVDSSCIEYKDVVEEVNASNFNSMRTH